MADWNDYYKNSPDAQLQFPSETLVRLFKGPYVPGMPDNLYGKTVLEVGCGSGNNLEMMQKLGLEVAGVEISPSIAELAAKRLKSVPVYYGSNTNLTYARSGYDFLVSWNVIHYCESEKEIKAAIKEHARVLESGGRLFLSTTGHYHPIRNTAKRLGGMRHEITLDGDFRKGSVQCFFTDRSIHEYFGECFTDIVVSEVLSELLGKTLHWYIVTATKP